MIGGAISGRLFEPETAQARRRRALRITLGLPSSRAPSRSLAEVGARVEFRFAPGREPLRQLLGYLREKQLVLLMDNFEHVIAGAALVSEMLQACAGVKVLCTSREPLRTPLWRLVPLPLVQRELTRLELRPLLWDHAPMLRSCEDAVASRRSRAATQ